VIRLDTIQALYEHHHALAAYCPACRRWATLDLKQLIAAGHGGFNFIGWKPRCGECGAGGELQLRPPVMPPGTGGIRSIQPRRSH
jgi:hypothetical protein